MARNRIEHCQIALAVVVLLSACASKGFVKSFVDPGYVQGTIQSIAVFPVRNAGRAPGEAREINISLVRSLASKNPGLNVMPPSDSIRLINDAGLTASWNVFVDGLFSGGIPDREAIDSIGKALSVDAVLQADVSRVVQVDGNGWDTVASTRVTLNCTVYEAATGRLVWEASADGVIRKGRRAAPPVTDAIDVAMKLVAQNIPVF